MNSLARGFSGIRRTVIDALIALLNAGSEPSISRPSQSASMSARRPPPLSTRAISRKAKQGALIAMGAGVILTAVTAGWPWVLIPVAVMGVTGVMASVAFVAWARRIPFPLVDLALFQHRTYRYVNLATLSFGTAFSMMFLTFFFYVMNIWHYSLPQAGLAVTPGPLLVMPTAIVTGRLASRLGHRRFLVGGSLLYALSGLWFLLVPGNEPNYVLHWLPGLILSGISVGLVLPSLSAAAVSRLPAAHYAVGSAVNQATRQIGSVLGVALTVALLGHATLQRADFDALYLLHAALALVTGLLCLPVDTKPRAAQS